MTWTQESRAAWGEAMRERWHACHVMCGKADTTLGHGRAKRAKAKPPRGAPRPRSRAGWTKEAREAARVRQRAAQAAIDPLERSKRARHAALAQKGMKWTQARRRAHKERMRQMWKEWRDGTRQISSAQARWLAELGMWGGTVDGGTDGT